MSPYCWHPKFCIQSVSAIAYPFDFRDFITIPDASLYAIRSIFFFFSDRHMQGNEILPAWNFEFVCRLPSTVCFRFTSRFVYLLVMEPPAKRSRVCLSAEKKAEILVYVSKNPLASQGEVGRHFGVGQSSISTIIKIYKSTFELVSSGMSGVKRKRGTNCNLLEQGLEKFYYACVAKELRAVSYDMMITKAQKISEELISNSLVESEDLPGTDTVWKSFVQRFLAKRAIKSKKLHGEAAVADIAAAEKFLTNEWPDIFTSVDNDDSRVWNMDETGLFWRALRDRTLSRSDKRLAGGKTQKDRIPFAVAVSMAAGEKLFLHGIGNSKNPRAVAAVKSTPDDVLGGRWNSNPKAWMNSEVFGLDISRKFRQRNKKIVLLVDNCPGHKVDAVESKLDFVRVVFLPKNTTSIIQPCDAGIIQAFKSGYRRLILRKVV